MLFFDGTYRSGAAGVSDDCRVCQSEKQTMFDNTGYGMQNI